MARALVFEREADAVGAAPATVTLLGDPRGEGSSAPGLSLSIALPRRCEVALARRDDRTVRIASTAYDGFAPATFELGASAKRGNWVDYASIAVACLARAGYAASGFDATVESDITIGIGLGASMAVVVALLRALNDAYAIHLEDAALADLARAAEREITGTPIGIAEAHATVRGRTDEALFVDSRADAIERVKIPGDAELFVIDSGGVLPNAAAERATRRSEIARGAAVLERPHLGGVELGPATMALFAPLNLRVRHVVNEGVRVRRAIDAAKAGDGAALGALLTESHASLRDDFEVVPPHVDHLVEIAQRDDDVFGARMTGEGFGGAVVGLAKKGTAQAAIARILANFAEAGGSGKAVHPV